MNTPIAIKDNNSKTNYTGLEDGAEPVEVYRTAKFTVAHVGEPKRDSFFSNDFRTVKLVDQSNSQLMTSFLMDCHYGRLVSDLVEGGTIELQYEVGSNWIKAINGKRWN